ncbi:hypothetical protein Spla01_04449 [Streptomyces platensis]|uniref:Uncharacterized protein n=1 Tax=Streptomyces platensis TaxID=58346 RepID=A0ABX3XMW5_STRPT|nr:hypothetical protein BG653_06441 [Streptomyces platensis]
MLMPFSATTGSEVMPSRRAARQFLVRQNGTRNRAPMALRPVSAPAWQGTPLEVKPYEGLDVTATQALSARQPLPLAGSAGSCSAAPRSPTGRATTPSRRNYGAGFFSFISTAPEWAFT